VKHSIFALELCLRLEPGSTVRAELHDIVTKHPEVSDPGEKWNMLHRACELLMANEELFERGCWDFFDVDKKAKSDYEMWCNGLITEEGARQTPSGQSDPYRPQGRYMTFTIALLLVADSKGERKLSEVCNVRDDLLWSRSTFHRVLKGLKHVNFAFVKSDVFYLIPGDEGWGLTDADLQDQKFEYLRPLQSG